MDGPQRRQLVVEPSRRLVLLRRQLGPLVQLVAKCDEPGSQVAGEQTLEPPGETHARRCAHAAPRVAGAASVSLRTVNSSTRSRSTATPMPTPLGTATWP